LILLLRLFLDANVLVALGRAGACELVASGYAVAEARPSALEFAASGALTDPADVPILAAAIRRGARAARCVAAGAWNATR
jgi:hypothetical protein